MTASSELHPLKTDDPVDVSCDGNVTELRAVHPLNALLPILVIVSGITTDVIAVFPSKADAPIAVIVIPSISCGITTSPPIPLYFVIVESEFVYSSVLFFFF